MKPKLHRPVPMNTPVKLSEMYGNEVTGVVTGVSFMDVFFMYIVTLDMPVTHPEIGEEVTSVIAMGTDLEGLNGENWSIK